MIALNKLINDLPESWHKMLLENLETISEKINDMSLKFSPLEIYPKQDNIFKAFSFNSIYQIRVVIIGQDCYHGPNQATGLCFAVNNEITSPPSLRNIKKEINEDLSYELLNTDLINWAEQGVLLLNSALTVQQSLAGSHLKIWSNYTDNIIREFSKLTDNVVFLLWGNYAKSKAKLIDSTKNHYILEASHPSPLSANRGGWFGCKHFSKTNEFLAKNGYQEIDWK